MDASKDRAKLVDIDQLLERLNIIPGDMYCIFGHRWDVANDVSNMLDEWLRKYGSR